MINLWSVYYDVSQRSLRLWQEVGPKQSKKWWSNLEGIWSSVYPLRKLDNISRLEKYLDINLVFLGRTVLSASWDNQWISEKYEYKIGQLSGWDQRPLVRLSRHCVGTSSCPHPAPTSLLVSHPLFCCKCVKLIDTDDLAYICITK